MKEYGSNTRVKYGMQINPQAVSGYANYRQKPTEFQKLLVQCGVPRHLGNQQLIMNVNWLSYDHITPLAINNNKLSQNTNNNNQ